MLLLILLLVLASCHQADAADMAPPLPPVKPRLVVEKPPLLGSPLVNNHEKPPPIPMKASMRNNAEQSEKAQARWRLAKAKTSALAAFQPQAASEHSTDWNNIEPKYDLRKGTIMHFCAKELWRYRLYVRDGKLYKVSGLPPWL